MIRFFADDWYGFSWTFLRRRANQPIKVYPVQESRWGSGSLISSCLAASSSDIGSRNRGGLMLRGERGFMLSEWPQYDGMYGALWYCNSLKPKECYGAFSWIGKYSYLLVVCIGAVLTTMLRNHKAQPHLIPLYFGKSIWPACTVDARQSSPARWRANLLSRKFSKLARWTLYNKL